MLYVIVTASLLFAAAEWVQAQNNGDVRLVNDPKRGSFSGRLEVFIDGKWGTICSKGSADLQAVADTACKQLGLTQASLLYGSGTVKELGFPVAPKSTPVHFGSINCGSSASDGICSTDYYQHLLRCAVDANVNTAACTHDKDIAINCLSSRLTSSPYRSQLALLAVGDKHHSLNLSMSSGGLVVFLDNSSKYGVVCGKDFVKNAADTACRQLGYTNANHFNTSLHGATNQTFWDAGLNCKSQSHSCLNNCFSKMPTNRTSCTNVVNISCEFDISLKDTESAGSPRLCDATVDDNCKPDIEEYTFTVPIVISVLVVVAVLALCATCITLLVCYFVPGCLIHRKRSGYKSIN